MTTFAERLRLAMEMKNLRAVDLHNLTGIGKPAISEYLAGNYEPKQQNIFKLATAMRVSPGYLMGLSDNPEITTPILPQLLTGKQQDLLDKYARLSDKQQDALSTLIDTIIDR